MTCLQKFKCAIKGCVALWESHSSRLAPNNANIKIALSIHEEHPDLCRVEVHHNFP